MKHDITHPRATTIDLEFVRTTGHVHLSESILRRKMEWHEIVVAAMDDALVGYLCLDYLWSTVPFIATWVSRNGVFGMHTRMASGKCSSAKDFDNTGAV